MFYLEWLAGWYRSSYLKANCLALFLSPFEEFTAFDYGQNAHINLTDLRSQTLFVPCVFLYIFMILLEKNGLKCDTHFSKISLFNKHYVSWLQRDAN